MIEKLAASEALLRFKIKTTKQFDQLFKFAQNNIRSPYLLKNIVLLIANSDINERNNRIIELGNKCNDMIVVDAIQFALFSQDQIFDIPEPDT